jgi:hypothetical protein
VRRHVAGSKEGPAHDHDLVDATQGLDVGLGRQRDVGQRACIIIGV